jgi:hypothetical protein
MYLQNQYLLVFVAGSRHKTATDYRYTESLSIRDHMESGLETFDQEFGRDSIRAAKVEILSKFKVTFFFLFTMLICSGDFQGRLCANFLSTQFDRVCQGQEPLEDNIFIREKYPFEIPINPDTAYFKPTRHDSEITPSLSRRCAACMA